MGATLSVDDAPRRVPSHLCAAWIKLANMVRACIDGAAIDALLKSIHGGLSRPSKMPGYAYGIPAIACKIGSVLRGINNGINNSVCASCYAMKGMYRFSGVQRAQQRRLESITRPLWSVALALSIARTNTTHFRFHDSGDVQSIDHLRRIFDVCVLLPDVQFWLPTRERKIVANLNRCRPVPPNLVIRISAPMVDQNPPVVSPYVRTSTVHDKGKAVGYACPASSQQGKCGDCRACWNPSVSNVSYPRH